MRGKLFRDLETTTPGSDVRWTSRKARCARQQSWREFVQISSRMTATGLAYSKFNLFFRSVTCRKHIGIFWTSNSFIVLKKSKKNVALATGAPEGLVTNVVCSVAVTKNEACFSESGLVHKLHHFEILFSMFCGGVRGLKQDIEKGDLLSQ